MQDLHGQQTPTSLTVWNHLCQAGVLLWLPGPWDMGPQNPLHANCHGQKSPTSNICMAHVEAPTSPGYRWVQAYLLGL